MRDLADTNAAMRTDVTRTTNTVEVGEESS